MAKNTHDVTSLDTWSRRLIGQFECWHAATLLLLCTPQDTIKGANPLKLLLMILTPVYRLSPDSDGLS
ncbi:MULTISPECIES: hypothetical protein [Pseudomonas]|uniref:hypothetical protein n=1 Tax=Pseudomonas TaxID=286 RepID=UPI001112B130|nr:MULTISPECIES: hypothetical protein [Pseudomonas]MBS5840326.1 hypothetical protein [Pseudomonas sp.]NLU00352.1 hypothetical protein [Pseudomonas lundensis]NNA00024.1 hypothetical protein [Pseudomonas lundensis]NNA05231.1 hypothetical protein [Pseudomonas lundensis]NNA20977.1 hypothetical protein [Pseudomonas lundensis]